MNSRPALLLMIAALVFVRGIPFAAAQTGKIPPAEKSSISLTPEQQAWLEDHPVVTMATFREGAPYGFVDEQGKYVGVIPDITARLEKLLGIRIKFKPVEYGELLEQVRTGSADLTTLNDPSDMPYGEHYLKTEEFLFLPYALFVRKDSPLAKNPPRTVSGRTIALIKGWDPGNPGLEPLRGNTFVFAESMLACINLVLQGKADGFYDVLSNTNYVLANNFIRDIALFKVYDEGYPVAFFVRKDWPELKSALQQGLFAISRDERAQLLQKWNAFLGDSLNRLRLVDLDQSERQWLKDHRVIRVGIHTQWPPMEFVDADGRRQGIASEYLAHIQKMLGIRFEILQGPCHEYVDMAERGELDMLSCAVETPSSAGKLKHTKPYLVLPLVILTGTEITYVAGLEALRGRRVAVREGHPAQQWLARDYPGIRLVPTASVEEMFRLLVKGQVHAGVESLPTAGFYLGKPEHAAIRVSGQTPYAYRMSMAVRSDYGLFAGILQKALDAIPAEQRAAENRRWMAVARERVTDYGLLWKVLLPLLLVLGAFVYWTRRLFHEVSSRKQAETLLREAQKNLEQRVRERTLELEQAGHTLRAGEERFRAIAENSPDAILITDVKGILRYCNRAAENMFGYGPDEMIGQDHSIILPPRLREAEAQKRQTYLASAEFSNICSPVQSAIACRKDGTEFPIEFPFFSWKADDEFFFTAIIRDITGRKRMEHALRSERERLAGIIAASPVIICGITANGTTSFINSAGEEITGYTNQELEGLNWWDTFYPGELRAQVEDLFSRLDRQDILNHEMTLQTKQGQQRIILWNSITNRDSRGALLEVIGFGNDITERKWADNEVRQARDFLENIFKASPDAIIVTDSYGYIIMANESVYNVYGYLPEELVGQHASVFATDDETMLHRTFAMMEQLYEEGIVRNFTAERRHKDGHSIQTEASIVQIKSPEGTPAGGISSSRDITGRKRLEEQLRHSQKMEAIGTLAGGIAHDFNNILGIIFGYTELSQDLAAGSTQLESNLRQILKAAERARGLVRQILAFSRKSENDIKPLQLNLIVKEALKLLRASLPSTIEIRTDFEDAEDMVMADATEIHQIIMNLCTNAAHAMHQTGGVLTIQLKALAVDEHSAKSYSGIEPGPYVHLSVKDTGCGIPAGITDRIFEPFFTTKGVGKGTGMGLSVVHGIVKRLRGDIKVYSEPGRGSVFHVMLPCVLEQAQESSAIAVQSAPRGDEAVLLVDDEPLLLAAGMQMLDSLGYRVTAISNPLEALELFKMNAAGFDVVITDQTMPGLSGYELAQQLLKIRKDIPAILCTGYSDTVTAESALAGGIKAFVIKPLNRQALAKTLRDVLDEGHMQKQLLFIV